MSARRTKALLTLLSAADDQALGVKVLDGAVRACWAPESPPDGVLDALSTLRTGSIRLIVALGAEHTREACQ